MPTLFEPIGRHLRLEYGKALSKADRIEAGGYPAYGANGSKIRSRKYLKDQPSIIVGRKGSAGEVTLSEDKFWPLDVTYFVEFDRSRHDLRYLFHLLLWLDISTLSKGVKPGINREDVYRLTAPFPHIVEQQRIAAILDEALEGVAAATARAERNVSQTKSLLDSIRNEMFHPDCARHRIEDVCDAIVDCPNRTAPTVDKPTPFKMIRTTNVRHGKIDLSSTRYVEEATYHRWTRRQVPQRGDVLLTREAPMGEVGMIDFDDHVFLGQRIVSYRANENRMASGFLLHVLQTKALQDQIRNKASGSTVQHMRVPDTKTLLVPVPSLVRQSEIVAAYEEIQRELERVREINRTKSKALAELRQSLLARAFSGALTREPIAA